MTIIGPRTKTSPASTRSPLDTPTGIGSPVNGARAIAPLPSIITPSTGTTSPDLISTMSPTLNACIGIHSSSDEPFKLSEAHEPSSQQFSSLADESLASLGNLSNPPCIAVLALTNALSSRWDAKATSPVTIRASGYSCKIIAPITANDVRTWKPRTLFLILDAAALNIGKPANEIPITVSRSAALLGM